jgi:Caspase domain
MKNRRALLIGVPEYDSDRIDNLPVVNQDLELLHTSLEKSGFSVRSLGTDGAATTTQNKIKQAIRKECKEAQKTEVLLLYFSGHGIHYQGKDYLVPSDADLDDAECIEDYLISSDLGELFVDLDKCNAKTIIFFIDACREGVKLAWKSLSLASFGKGDRTQISKRRCVLVFACESGKYSQYVSGENGYSLFAKALSEVIDPQDPSITLHQILKETQRKLDSLVQEFQKKEQKIHYSFESSVDDETLSRIICEGLPLETKLELENNPWTEEALKSSLWQVQETTDSSTIDRLKEQVDRIVTVCWQKWQAAIQAFPQDAWRDRQFPLRMLDSIELLVFRSDPPIKLTDAETALIITIPFIREAVLANGVIEAVGANPLSLDKKGIELGFGTALDKLHQSQPRFIRKAQRLQDQGCASDRDAVMTWLMHRCLLKTIEVWIAKSEGGYLSDDFIQKLDDIDKNQHILVKQTLPAKRLLELARCTLVDIERIDREDRPDPLQDKLTVGSYREEQEIREKVLAYLLKLAGLLAIDLRVLADVLVDHIGLSDPLRPENVITTLNQARWNPIGKGRTLKVTCHHPAVDLTLRNHVQNTAEILSYILQQTEKKQGIMSVLQGLPTHLLSDDIVAEKQNNVPVYQIPHVNFQLAHDEIRELLMGEQLYGDPTLAIRELYQNALDACRYREARIKYLQQTGKYQGNEWQGKIIFRQGRDERGREYIECEDNGIGMEMQHLSQCFARAGRRFADLPEFIEEQAEWLKCEPPIRLYPNSQFGIGVLSYFMLTDEIEVKTCRLDRHGKPEQQLQVRIPGSSGLFRTQDLGKGKESGTIIRLYLNLTHYQDKPISCLEILRRLLWVAEFETEVQEFEQQEFWRSGQLRHPELAEEFYVNANHPDLWWITEKGRILSDGLVTEELHSCVVINLCGSHRPKLTVDRKKIVGLDLNSVRKELIEGAKSLLEWSHLSFEWLWSLEQSEVFIAERVVSFLIQNNIYIPRTTGNNNDKSIQSKLSLAEIGCFYHDKIINEHAEGWESEKSKKIKSHRLSIWRNKGKEYSSSISFPVMLPGDAVALLGKNNEGIKELRNINVISIDNILRAALALDESIAKSLGRLQKFNFLGIKSPIVDLLFLKDIQAAPEDLILLSIHSDGTNPWLKKEVSCGYLAKKSMELNKPIAEIYLRLQQFSPLGLKLPKVKIESLNNSVLTKENSFLLSENLDGKSPWVEQEISIVHIFRIASKLNISIASAFEKIQDFTQLGFDLPKGNFNLFEEVYIEEEILNILLLKQQDRPFVSDACTFLLDVLSGFICSERFYNLKFHDLAGDLDVYAEQDLFCQHLPDEVTRIIKTINSFVSLGINLEPIEIDFLKLLKFEDLDRLHSYTYGGFNWDEHTPALIHLLEVSSDLSEPISKSLKSLQKFVSLGLKLPEISIEYLADFIVTGDDFGNLSEYDSNLDEGCFEWLDTGTISPYFLLNRYWSEQSLNNYAEEMQRYRPLGVSISKNIPENLDEVISTDFYLLQNDFDDRDGGDGYIDKVTLVHILRSANWINEPLGKTIERFQRFFALGIAGILIPENIPKSIRNYKVKSDDLELLCKDLRYNNDLRNWLEDKVTPLHIIQAATVLKKPVSEIINSLQKFTPLGLDIPQISAKFYSEYIADQEEMIAFSENLDGKYPWFKEKISSLQIIRSSVVLNETVATTLKRLQRFIHLGVDVPILDPDLLGDFTANLDDITALSQDLDRHEPWLESEISLHHMFRVSMWTKMSVANILSRLRRLEPLGFIVPEINTELLEDLTVTQADLIVLSQDLDGATPWIEGEVTDFHLTCAAQRLNEPIEATLKRLDRFVEILNLKLPLQS